jgi:hypothetical protein
MGAPPPPLHHSTTPLIQYSMVSHCAGYDPIEQTLIEYAQILKCCSWVNRIHLNESMAMGVRQEPHGFKYIIVHVEPLELEYNKSFFFPAVNE